MGRNRRFSLFEFVSTIALLPVGVGVVAVCYVWSFSLVSTGFATGATRTMREWIPKSGSFFPELFYHIIVDTIAFLVCWIFVAIVVAVFAVIKTRITQSFATSLLLATPLVQLLLSQTLSVIKTGPFFLLASQLICAVFSIMPSIITYCFVRRARQSNRQDPLTHSRGGRYWRLSATVVLIVVTLTLSGMGWQMLKFSGAFNID